MLCSKPLRLTDRITVMSLADEAVDEHASWGGPEHEREFARKHVAAMRDDVGCWRDRVKLKPGAAPTEFVMGVIPPSELSRIEDDARLGTDDQRNSSLWWGVFVAALRDIKNLGQEVPKVTRDGMDRVDPAWLERTFHGKMRTSALEVGLYAYNWHQMGTADAKN